MARWWQALPESGHPPGITGLFGYLITTDYTIQYTLVILVAAAVAFLLSWILFKEENIQAADTSVPAADASVQTAASSVKTEEGHTVYCPIKGEVIELKDVKRMRRSQEKSWARARQSCLQKGRYMPHLPER